MAKNKKDFYDDGRTIANMDYEHISGYKSEEERKKQEEIRELNLSRKERSAIYKAAFSQFMPVFGIFIGALLLVILFLYKFWLN